MPETRTTSATGGEKGMKDERHDLLPREGIEAIARVFAFGATKYADHNWRKGYEWSKSYAALQRHLYAFWSGETHDEESGLPHLSHAGFHILALLTWLEVDGEGSQFDDRYVPKHRADVPTIDWQDPTPLTEETRRSGMGWVRDYDTEIERGILRINDDLGPDLLRKRPRVDLMESARVFETVHAPTPTDYSETVAKQVSSMLANWQRRQNPTV